MVDITYPLFNVRNQPSGVNLYGAQTISAELKRITDTIPSNFGKETTNVGLPQCAGLGDGGIVEYVNQIEHIVPWIKHMRATWYINSFDGDGNLAGRDKDVWREMIGRGWKILLNFFDRPTQRFFSPDRGIDHLMQCWSRRHVYAWTRMMEFLDQNPDIAAGIYGYEALNEPNGYNQMQNAGIAYETAVFYYTQHVKAIFDVCKAKPGPELLVGGWRYQASPGPMNNVKIPQFDGRTGMEELRRAFPGRVFISALHKDDIDGMRSETLDTYIHRYGTSDLESRADWLGYIEQNVQTEVLGYRDNGINQVPIRVTAQHRMNADFNDARHYFGMKPWWWPLTDTANARLANVSRNGTSRLTAMFKHTTTALVNITSYPNLPEFFSGPQSGMKGRESSDTFVHEASRFFRSDTEEQWASDQKTPTKNLQMIHYFGGKGTCVIDVEDDTYNCVYGGDGKTVVNGGDTSFDIVWFGRGGGIVRTGGGFNVVTTHWQNCRVYAGQGRNAIWCYVPGTPWTGVDDLDHETTLILDPKGHHYITDWHHGHKISFKGAFASFDEMRAALTYMQPYVTDWTTEILIRFPQGGSVQFTHGDLALNQLFTNCLDWSDGWYSQGWSEPVDYTQADLAAPLAEDYDDLYTWRDNGNMSLFVNKWGDHISVNDKWGNPFDVKMKG